MARAKKEREYAVEALCKARVSYKKGRNIHWQYLVKWAGYGEKDNTWEPSECFEESPGLLRAFWRHVDPGKRTNGDDKQHTRASDFKIGDELTPRDGAVPATAVTDADEEADEKKKKTKGESKRTSAARPAPRPRGRKRSLSENEAPLPKRRRGRPSKKLADDSAGDDVDGIADADGDPEDDDGASQVDDSKRRVSQRLSENLSSDARSEAHFEGEADEGRQRPRLDATTRSTNLESQSLKNVRTALSAGGSRPRRRPVIVSDDDAEGDDTDYDSQAGSLFSGDDEVEDDDGKGKEKEVQPGILSHSPMEATPPSVSPTDLVNSQATQEGPSSSGIPITQGSIPLEDQPKGPTRKGGAGLSDALRLEEARKRLLQARNSQKPRVTLAEDPDVTKAIQERLGNVAKQPGNGIPSTEGAPETTSQRASQIPPAAPSAPENRPAGSFRSTLLTFDKGKLLSQRRKADVPQASPVSLTSAEEVKDVDTVLTHDSNMDFDDAGPSEGFRDQNLADVDIVDTVGPAGEQAVPAATSSIALPPPTAVELLQLAGIEVGQADLPDFDIDEDMVTVEQKQTTEENIVAEMVLDIGDADTEVQVSTQETRVWAQSTIFAPAAPVPGLDVAASSSVVPLKSVMMLRLNPSTAIPTSFRDIHPASWNPKEMLVDLLPGEQDGLPGKLYPQAVLDHIACGGSLARLSAEESATAEQRDLLSKLIRSLEENGDIFISAISCLPLVMIPSTNRAAADRLNFPSSLIGLSQTMIIQHVQINNDTAFADFALEAKDFKF